MMNNMKKVVSIVLVLVMLLALTGCTKFPTIQKAFENDGYSLDQNSLVAAGANAIVKSYYKDEEKVPYTAHTFVKGLLNYAVIIEFNSTKELKDFYDNSSNTLKGFVKDLSESDVVNGNCLILTLNKDALEIFKKA